MDVSNDAGGRLIANNKRNSNNQESFLGELSDAIMGLREEMKDSRKHSANSGKEMKMEQK